MGVSSAAAGALIVDALVMAWLWFGLAALLMRMSRQPALRREVSRIALVGSLGILPSLVWTPIPQFHLVPTASAWWSPPTTSTVEPSAEGIPDRGPGLVFQRPGALAPVRGPGPSVSRLRTIAGVYLTGSLLFAAWIGLGVWALRRLLREARPPGPGVISALDLLGWSSRDLRPRVRTSRRVGRPALVGWIGPVILIPAELDRPEHVELLRLALQHELIHHEACDAAYAALAAIGWVFWYPVLPFWWIQSQQRMDQEYLTDRESIRRLGTEPVRYARSLVGLAPSSAGLTPPEPTDPPLATWPASTLMSRALMLLECPFPVQPRLPAGYRWLAWVSAAIVLTALSTIRLGL